MKDLHVTASFIMYLVALFALIYIEINIESMKYLFVLILAVSYPKSTFLARFIPFTH